MSSVRKIYQVLPIMMVFLLIIATISCLAAPLPKVFFSDLTDGTITGWNNTTTKGAAVTIWGNNFGTSRGASYVTVGGIRLADDSDYAEWAATANPITPRGLQRITFWLRPNMSLGNTTISVTTPSGTSQQIPFFTRNTGRIFFIARNGSDANSGLTTQAPWFSLKKARETLRAGDVVYIRTGVWTEYDDTRPYGGAVLCLEGGRFNNGTNHNTIAIASYPGEMAQLGDGQHGPDQLIMRGTWSTNTLENWTFSKLKGVAKNHVFSWVSTVNSAIDKNLRIIGMDIRTTHAAIGHGMGMSIFSNWQNVKLYGNYFHHAGKAHDNDPHGYKVESIYFCGGGVSDGIDIGWNEFYKNNGTIQFFGHFRSDSVDHLKIHDNYVHDNGTSILVLGGGDPQTNPQYDWLHHVTVFNNVFSGNGGGLRVATTANGLSGDFEMYNNTFYNNCRVTGGAIIQTQGQDSFSFHNNIVSNGPKSKCSSYWTNQIAGYGSAKHSNNEDGIKNSWSGLGDGPVWSTNDQNEVEPLFVVSSPVTYFDYLLSENLPLSGQNIGVQFDAIDQGGSGDGGGSQTLAAPQGFQLVNN